MCTSWVRFYLLCLGLTTHVEWAGSKSPNICCLADHEIADMRKQIRTCETYEITNFQNQGLDFASKWVLVRGLAVLFQLLPNLSAWNSSNI